ncbi:MAG: hypothetical protein K5686_12100 [Lachnospiraceae bacterium]|nr:hypothetical protein [Lachnospiraceae bacterium]
MGKKIYRGIEMEVSSYDTSKDMMRRGLSGGSLNPNDNCWRTMFEYLEFTEVMLRQSRRRLEAGFMGLPRGWRRK